jgi:hypothetical protein
LATASRRREVLVAHRPGVHAGRAVDQDVDGTELGHHLGNHSGHGVIVAGIARDGEDATRRAVS